MTIIAGIDTETTGLDTEKDRIVEIGLILMELETGRELYVLDRKVNPGMHIPPKVVEVHGITDADVMGAPTFDRVAPAVVALLARATLVVGHNTDGFDLPLLVNELIRVGVSATAWPASFDTAQHGRGCTDDGKMPTLGELCYALDTPYDPEQAHGAAYDVRVNLQAFRRGWKLGVFQHPALPPAMPVEVQVAA